MIEKFKDFIQTKKGMIVTSCSAAVVVTLIITVIILNVRSFKQSTDTLAKLPNNKIYSSALYSTESSSTSTSSIITSSAMSPSSETADSASNTANNTTTKSNTSSASNTANNTTTKSNTSSASKKTSSATTSASSANKNKNNTTTKSSTSSANKKTSTVKLPTVNTSIPSNYMSSSDFYYFYICGKQFKLGQSLSTVINSGFTTSNNKNKVVAPGESQPAMIFNKSISQTAFCGLTVKNTSNSSKKLTECTIIEAYQNNAYDSHFRTKYFDGSLPKNNLIAALGNPTKVVTDMIESYYYINGNKKLSFDYLSGKPIYFGISIE